MKNEDNRIIEKMIKYCDDINTLLTRFNTDFEKYKADISFQYACNIDWRIGKPIIRGNKRK